MHIVIYVTYLCVSKYTDFNVCAKLSIFVKYRLVLSLKYSIPDVIINHILYHVIFNLISK